MCVCECTGEDKLKKKLKIKDVRVSHGPSPPGAGADAGGVAAGVSGEDPDVPCPEQDGPTLHHPAQGTPEVFFGLHMSLF